MEKEFVYLNPEKNAEGQKGALSGKTVALEPDISVKGWPSDTGSPALENYTAVEDAVIVERLCAAGAYIKGYTRMSELGFGLHWNTTAQAVSGGKADIAVMADKMGELRVSAASFGILGYKPSYGAVSRYGLIGLIPSMECLGIMSGSIKNISETMKIISGCDDRDLSIPDQGPADFNTGTDMKQTRAGFIAQSLTHLNEDDASAFQASLAAIGKAGTEVVELGLEDFDIMGAVHNIIGAVETSSSTGKYDSVRYGHRAVSDNNWNEMYIRSRAESFNSLVKAYMLQGAYFQYKAYSDFVNACRVRARIIKKTKDLFKKVDFIVMPARRTDLPVDSARTVSDIYGIFIFGVYAGLTGCPAVSIPWPADSVPGPGIQVMGPLNEDGKLLLYADSLLRQLKGEG